MLLALCLLLAAFSSFAEDAPSSVLVVYFSRAGENWSVGVIEEGNTTKLAKIIAEQTEADLFEIVPEVPYPSDYDSTLAIATREKEEDARPAYLDDVENWAQYDTVFIGYPIWWGGVPCIISTFLESHDFSGKTVIPFNTHEGSGQGGTQQVIKGKLLGITVLQGLAVRGSQAQNDAEGTTKDVNKWLNSLGLMK
ncbi:MAG: NAD(P)H-dependent oxidoreductase [Clostridia bacterium]|nr:NAD(P)H-dependent oxidoreductase [Clostridia bacterium]